MSLILDALRRAESQRQHTSQPAWSLPRGGSTARRTQQLRLPRSVVIAGSVTALVAVGLITGVLLGRGTSPGTPAIVPVGAAPALAAPARGEQTAGRGAALAGSGAGGEASGRRELASLSTYARPSAPVPGSTDPRGNSTLRGSSGTAAAAPGTVQIVDADQLDDPALLNGARAAGAGRADSPAPSPARPGTMEVRDLMAEQGIATGGGEISVATSRPAPAPAAAAAPSSDAALTDAAVLALDSAPTDFTLNMLSTSPNPANSYVYINMKRYRIGERTAEGAFVDEINESGAVIRFRGQRYLLRLR